MIGVDIGDQIAERVAKYHFADEAVLVGVGLEVPQGDESVSRSARARPDRRREADERPPGRGYRGRETWPRRRNDCKAGLVSSQMPAGRSSPRHPGDQARCRAARTTDPRTWPRSAAARCRRRVDDHEMDRPLGKDVDDARQNEPALQDVLRRDRVADVDELAPGARSSKTPLSAATYEPLMPKSVVRVSIPRVHRASGREDAGVRRPRPLSGRPRGSSRPLARKPPSPET